ncbi:MAG: transcriptional regulator [Elusimicrobia bacterium]|jgi:HTH-type transcriptional regulator/antitoxin HigA|nr:transcriptional regulator [Elusimicrobiota bacterium]
MRLKLKEIIKAWPVLSKALSVPHKRAEYEETVALLDELIDTVGENENHPLASLMETLSAVVEAYEQHHVPEFSEEPRFSLRALMKEHGLTQGNLPEVGSQGVVSEVLNGKRRLNIRQIQALSHRFGVAPAVFL